jgi:hypothetical protein
MSTTQRTSVSRRVVYFDRLARAVHAGSEWSDQHRLWVEIVTRRLCLVLFELPRHVQIGLAVATAERYLPAFEQRHPHLTQLREFLVRCLTADPPTAPVVDRWYGTLAQEDRDDNHTGRSLVAAVSYAAEAAPEGAAPMTVTSACVLSVHDSIGVSYWEAWEAFDPEAAELAREDIRRTDLELPDLPYNPLQDRNRWHPEVLNAVYAGWEPVVAWLRAADVGQYPDPVDRHTLAKLLEHQKEPILPWVLYPPHPDMLRMDDEQ